MPVPATPALSASHAVLRGLIAINIICCFLFAGFFAASFLWQGHLLAEFQSRPGVESHLLLHGFRAIMVLAFAAVPFAHILLTRLLAIVETVRQGDPFVAENARRLSTIAFALLGLQLLDLIFGALSISYFSQVDEFAWSFALTGWLAVLLLFVLARVFEQGAKLRDDLEGTV